jgi:hypothetical protein
MEKKICSKCQEEKEVCEFGKNILNKDRLQSTCKECRKIDAKIYREKNPNKMKEWYKNNLDYALQQKKDYYEKNRELIKERSKLWAKNNRDKVNKYIKSKKEKNPLFKVELNIRGRMKQYLKQKNITQRNKTYDIVGIEINDLKKHIEKQFTKGMNWENYGVYGWHIDHIIPLCSANNENELLKLFHYTNLQPLWAEDNLKKNGRILI